MPLTAGVDNVPGTSGNDTINAAVGTDGTFTAADVINGGAGNDTLNVVDVATGGTNFAAALLNVSNVETLAVRGVDDLNVQAATIAFSTVKTTQSVDSTVVANAASNVEVSGATGAIVVDGGNNVIVTDATADKAVTVGATKVAAGSISITDTKVGNASIAVDGGTDVTINVAGVSDVIDTTNSTTIAATTDVISVGQGGAATDLPSGAVVINQAHTATAATDVTLNTVTVTGGTTVAITNTADTSKAATDTTGATLTQGAISVTGGKATTAVTVNQAAAVTENAAVTAVAAKAGTQKITFIAASAGDVITVTTASNQSIAFKAAKALTALEVADAFANLAKNATTGAAVLANGSYSNGSSGGFTNDWTSGAAVSESATTASVTFSTSKDLNGATAGLGLTSSNDLAVTHVDSGSSAVSGVVLGTVVDGENATLAETGRLGVSVGGVTVNGAITGDDVLTTVTLSGYGTSTVTSDALTTLNLSNSAGGLTATTASTGSITANLNKVTGSISVDGGSATVTGLTINASGVKSASAVTAAVAKTVTINADVDLDLTSSNFAAATKMVVTGAGKVTLDGDDSTSVLAAVDASAATGTVDASGVKLTAAGVYTGGSGADTFTVTASATKASTGGAGDDVITVTSFSTGGSVDAGEGVDTLVMTEAAAATADANTTFSTKATNFERITISTANTAASTLDMANLGQTTYVTTSGTGGVVYAGAGTVYAGTTTDKITFVYNGVTYTTAAFASTDDDATELNALIDAAVIVGTTTALGAGKVTATLTNSGADITLIADNGSASLTAGIYDASTDIAGVNQVLTLDKLASAATVVLTKGGSITAQVTDAATGTADSITVAMSQDGSLDAGTFTAANVETINISADDKVVDVTGAKDEFGADIADGKDDTNSVQTLLVVADKATVVNVTGSADLTLDTTSSTLVTVDASALTGKFVYTADGKSTGSTVTGGSGDDTLVASGNGDVLIGGAGNDKLTAANLSTLTGGAGNDTFAFAAVDATLYSTITDLSAGDVIDLATGSGFTSTKVSLAGAATFAQYLDAAIVAAAAGATTKGAAWFQFGGDTFLVAEADTSSGNTYGSGDAVIAITGLVDLSKAVFNATTGDLTIV